MEKTSKIENFINQIMSESLLHRIYGGDGYHEDINGIPPDGGL
jgi:hypothetical protein